MTRLDVPPMSPAPCGWPNYVTTRETPVRYIDARVLFEGDAGRRNWLTLVLDLRLNKVPHVAARPISASDSF